MAAPVRTFTVYKPFGFNASQIRGAGISSYVWEVSVVFKSPRRKEKAGEIEREQQVYNRLGGEHSGLLTYYGMAGDCLVLSLAEFGSIRHYYAKMRPVWTVSLRTKLRWIQEIAKTFIYIHSCKVYHADISANNIFLDGHLRTKVGDFAGSAIDDKTALVWYETSHSLSSFEEASVASDLFALGSTIYEILTGITPLSGLEHGEIERRFDAGQFPELGTLPACRDIIGKCWRGGYSCAEELASDIDFESITACLVISVYYFKG